MKNWDSLVGTASAVVFFLNPNPTSRRSNQGVQFFMPKKTTAKAIASCIRHPLSPISAYRPTPNATSISLSDFVGY